jgi:uncharacterized membrane protein
MTAAARARRASPWLLAALLGAAGITHFLVPEAYDAIVPPILPAPRAWTYASGVAEIAVAASLLPARTRRAGATAAAALLVVVFPANVWMAVEPGDVPRWLAVARLPLQVPLVLWALQVRRATAAR